MTTIIIPDIHNKVDWIEKWISGQRYDKIIFLGDYFDNFHDTPFEAGNTAYWLKESLKYNNRAHLLGNHDMPYMVNPKFNPMVDCPGWNKDKHKRINEILTRNDWDKFRPVYSEQGWMLSHAGWHKNILPVRCDLSHKQLIDFAEKSLAKVKQGSSCYVFNSGKRMQHTQYFTGGITWLDWCEEFEDIDGLKQIVGHTEYRKPDKKGESWNVDTGCRYYGVLQDDKFTTAQLLPESYFRPKLIT
jgi:hypothetical protein